MSVFNDPRFKKGQKSAAKKDLSLPQSGGSLPAGIEGGVAKLRSIKFDKYKSGDQKGKDYFYADAKVVSPKTFKDADGVVHKCEGKLTSVMEPLHDTPGRRRATYDQHLDYVFRILNSLGLSPEDVSEEGIKALCEEGVLVSFRTWKGKPTEQYPNPSTNETWEGAIDADTDTDDDEEEDVDVEDDGEIEDDSEEEETEDVEDDEEENEQASEITEKELKALARKADKDDEKAQLELVEIAEEQGIDAEKYDTWKEVAEAILNGEETEEEEEPEEEEEDEEDTSEISLQDQGDLADDGDEQCTEMLTAAAEEAGIDPNDYETWKDVAEALVELKKNDGTEDDDEDEEAEELEIEEGGVYSFRPPRSRKDVQVEVIKVFVRKKTCNVRTLDDDRTFRQVPYDKLSI